LARRPGVVHDEDGGVCVCYESAVSDALTDRLKKSLASVIRGKPRAIELVVIGALTEGHLLIEDVPGVGKTTLAKAFARSLELSFSRVQFTPDLLPTDIVGAQTLGPDGRLVFQKGPIFTQVLLADEINRASPRTQSALLEAMSERQVTVDGTTYSFPGPFIVLATQNPVDFQGTFPLPEAQLDRSSICGGWSTRRARASTSRSGSARAAASRSTAPRKRGRSSTAGTTSPPTTSRTSRSPCSRIAWC
jgi:hypothetical protein